MNENNRPKYLIGGSGERSSAIKTTTSTEIATVIAIVVLLVRTREMSSKTVATNAVKAMNGAASIRLTTARVQESNPRLSSGTRRRQLLTVPLSDACIASQPIPTPNAVQELGFIDANRNRPVLGKTLRLRRYSTSWCRAETSFIVRKKITDKINALAIRSSTKLTSTEGTTNQLSRKKNPDGYKPMFARVPSQPF
jgi:hypothetical protein